MTNLLVSLLPGKYKAIIQMGLRILEKLDTQEERDAAIKYITDALEPDGHISVPEWGKWGGMLGIIGSNGRKPK